MMLSGKQQDLILQIHNCTDPLPFCVNVSDGKGTRHAYACVGLGPNSLGPAEVKAQTSRQTLIWKIYSIEDGCRKGKCTDHSKGTNSFLKSLNLLFIISVGRPLEKSSSLTWIKEGLWACMLERGGHCTAARKMGVLVRSRRTGWKSVRSVLQARSGLWKVEGLKVNKKEWIQRLERHIPVGLFRLTIRVKYEPGLIRSSAKPGRKREWQQRPERAKFSGILSFSKWTYPSSLFFTISFNRNA